MLVKYLVIFIMVIAFIAPVSSHHSDAGLDMDSLVTFEGIVTEFSWRNPHVYLTVETTNESNERTEWTLQTGSIITRTRMGWASESFLVGDNVTVRGHPARDGRPYLLLDSIEQEGGAVLATVFERDSGGNQLEESIAPVSTSTLEGKWLTDRSKLVNYPDDFDVFFRTQLVLTAKGRAAQATFNELSDENPESQCIGRPTPAMIVVSGRYPLQIEFNADEEIVLIRSEYWDEERTVYMDGREHPESRERFPTGHSIGWWDEDILIVDTRNFTDHRSPYQTGVPSGGQKHGIERYQLTENGTRVVVEFMLTDPDYMAEPMIHSRELVYSPHVEILRFDCDPESTSRFLPQ